MAHNTLTIAGNSPNSQSQFPVVPLAQPFLLLTGAGVTSDYSNSGASSMVNFRFYSPTTTTSNTIGATLTRAGTNNDWVTDFTLQGGSTYVLQMTQNVTFSSTGYYAFQFVFGGTGTGPYAYVGSGAPAAYESSGIVTRVITLASNTVVSFSSPSNSNVSSVASQGTVPSEYSFLLVRQLT